MRTKRVLTASLKRAAALLLLLLFVLLPACQTPPKKNTGANSAHRTNASTSRNRSASYDGIDLFSASAERFGTDPRAARPMLVADTVWIVVVGTAGVISLAALVSGIKSARAGRPSPRRRT